MSSDERQAAAAGWYPDPGHSEQQRWWDGAAWSEDTQLTPEAIAARRRPGVPLWGKIVLGSLATVILIGVALVVAIIVSLDNWGSNK